MNKYTHSKQPTSQKAKVRQDGSEFKSKVQRGLDIRKIANQTTVERQFGHFHPKFGSALGAGYDGTTGVISKTKRSESVS